MLIIEYCATEQADGRLIRCAFLLDGISAMTLLRGLILLSLCLASGQSAGDQPGPAGSQNAPCPLLSVNDPVQRDRLLYHTCYLSQPTDLGDWRQITPAQLPAQLKWQASNGEQLAFPRSQLEYWIRLNLKNDGPTPGFWYLALDYAPVDYVSFTLHRANGSSVIETGDQRPFDARGIDYRYYLVPISLNAGEAATLYLRLSSQGALNLPLSLLTPDELVAQSNTLTLTHGLFYGALIIFALFNLLLFISSGTRYYFFNAFYMASLGLFLFAMGGFAYQHLWPGSPWLANTAVPLSMALCALAINLFGRSFLQVRRQSPLTSRLMTAQTGIACGLLVLALALPYNHAIAIITVAALALICSLFFIGVIRWRQGHSHAKWYVLSWSLMVLGTLTYALAAFGYIPDFLQQEMIMQSAIGGQVLLLNYAIVQRWRDMQKRLWLAENRAKMRLEREVAERTTQLQDAMRDLEAANQRLEALSTRDSLTGLHNRRYLDGRLTELIREAHRHLRPLALVVLDADHFKRINDHYGHAVGDLCLRHIADELKHAVHRPQDVVARFGGEEFALLLPDTDLAGAQRVTNQFLQRLASCPAGQREGLHIPLTLSAGVALLQADETQAQLFERADSALYRAKAGGRNQLAVAGNTPTPVGTATNRNRE